jgi:hypothetical protein
MSALACPEFLPLLIEKGFWFATACGTTEMSVGRLVPSRDALLKNPGRTEAQLVGRIEMLMHIMSIGTESEHT